MSVIPNSIMSTLTRAELAAPFQLNDGDAPTNDPLPSLTRCYCEIEEIDGAKVCLERDPQTGELVGESVEFWVVRK